MKGKESGRVAEIDSLDKRKGIEKGKKLVRDGLFSHKFQYRCYECGRTVETPYKSYFLSLGDCCGIELSDFWPEECFQKYTKEN